MKITRIAIALSAGLLGLYLLANPTLPQSGNVPPLLNLDSYIRITEEPFEMQESTTALCLVRAESAMSPHEPENPATAFCDVYVNPIAKETMISGEGVYPVGSLVIKSKLATPESKRAELFTVMQKMPAGYDADHGDWKYSVIDGKSYRQLAVGRIDSCIDCHAAYQETDYITRTYLAKLDESK